METINDTFVQTRRSANYYNWYIQYIAEEALSNKSITLSTYALNMLTPHEWDIYFEDRDFNIRDILAYGSLSLVEYISYSLRGRLRKKDTYKAIELGRAYNIAAIIHELPLINKDMVRLAAAHNHPKILELFEGSMKMNHQLRAEAINTAILYNHESLVRSLMNKRYYFNQDSILNAVKSQNVKLLNLVLSNLDKPQRDIVRSAINELVILNRADMLKILLKRYKGVINSKLMDVALSRGYVEVANILHCRSSVSKSKILKYVRSGNLSVINFLLDIGIDVIETVIAKDNVKLLKWISNHYEITKDDIILAVKLHSNKSIEFLIRNYNIDNEIADEAAEANNEFALNLIFNS